MAAYLEFCLIPACVGVQFSCHVTKLDIVRCLIAVNINREVHFEHMLSKFPVNVGFEIDSAIFCVEADLLADDGIHHFALDLQGCTERTVFCPLHAAHALYLPRFLGMEDVQIPCAVLQRFILIDPQFISCFSALKYFTVIFFVKQGSKFAVCIDCNGVKRCLKGISLSCFCYGKRCFHNGSAYRAQYLISLGRQIFCVNNRSVFRLLYRIHVRSIGQCLSAVCAQLYDIVSSVAQRIPYGHTLVLLRTECIQTLTDQFCRCFCNFRIFFLRLLIYLMDGGTRQNIMELICQDHLPHAVQFFGRICFSGLFCQNGQKL